MLNLAWATFGPSPIGATDSNHPGKARPAFEQEAETWGEVVCSNSSVRRRSKTSGQNVWISAMVTLMEILIEPE